MTYPLKVLVVEAHPDEAEMYTGGLCALLAEKGVAIKYLSLTNGDAGHYRMERDALKRRRAREAYTAARHLGVLDYEILDIHDGELMPDLAVRTAVISAIRRWQADIVITFHDECDGHLDNRAAGRAVREASSFLTNGNIVPDVPALSQTPIFLQMTDYGAVNFHKHDIVVDIEKTIEQKLKACGAHATQFYEFAPFERGFLDEVPDLEDWPAQRSFILKYWPEFMYALEAMRPALDARYGSGKRISFAESFQLADYGRKVTAEEISDLLGV
ncbi:PIG-L family deacetylase [Pararhizobium sp. YC-54]|uniref:PIG-L deacetylase family protein n=1 Tax=Pararhizobium sp. YC-54 TaxID=2986920 RepID=UPI0021F7BC08|nr:PIG-L family deacetylase [Pararhizobium sp. YC-54]MCV9999761.1 PIG-L family deacetylase [Pararhizobium sp. YC-54]